MQEQVLLTLQGIYKAFGTHTVLNGVDLTVTRGESVSIMGKSGCGKSTLLNILGAMDTSDAGIYRFGDADVTALNPRALAAFRGARLGYVFQRFHLIPDLSVLENVAMPLGYRGVPAKERHARARAALESVGMADKARALPATCSGGEQQRIAIARAVVGNPDLLLADEPTGNLDAASAAEIITLFDRLMAEGMTVILVTHDAEVAAHASTRYRMENGILHRHGQSS